MRRVLFTGGGTAGHVVPTLPLIDRLLADGAAVFYVGSTTGLETELLGDRAVTYFGIATGKLRRYFSIENLRDAFRVLRGIGQAYRILGRVRPQVVFSKGGFVSFPVVLAAWLRRIPVVAHESDFSPGLANRMAMRFTSILCTSFAGTPVSGFRGQVRFTGSPIRRALLTGDAGRGRRFLGIDGGLPVLLVTGGSLGAVVLNQAVRDALPTLTQRYHVVHLTGAGKLDTRQRPGYQQFEFLSDPWGDVLAAADLVISRAGANTLYELLALGKPNLLVPLSSRVSRGDQIENARFAEQAGFSLVLQEEELTPETLVSAVDRLWTGIDGFRARLAGYRHPDAEAALLNALADAAGETR